MKPNILIPIAIVVFSQAHSAEPTVTLAGVQVVMDDGGEDFDGFKTFNMDRGHKVALIVRSPEKAMVGFDDDEATITLGGAETECHFFSNMAFSKDRRSMKLEFHTTEPVKVDGQGRFKVAGGLPLVFATGKDETRSEVFAIKVGQDVVFPAGTEGMPKLKVKSMGKPDFGDAEFEIEFTTDRKVDEFAGFRFYTKDGKELKSERGGSSWMGFGKRGSGDFSYRLEATPTELVVAVETWKGREEKTVSVDLAAGVALDKP